MNRFFIPDIKLIKSLIKYANDRLIVDVGCGVNADLLYDFAANGYQKLLGVDIFLDYRKTYPKFRSIDCHPHLLSGSIQENQKLLSALNNAPTSNKPLVLLCRPCHHSELIDATIELFDRCEVLYIGLEKNIAMDLEGYEYERLDLPGNSAENEVILKIIR